MMTPVPGIADVTLGEIGAFVTSPQACGYFASLLVFATFWMQRMVPLRIVAIFSNLAFFTYAIRLGLMPIAILHAGLLPVNFWRLRQRLWPVCGGQPGAIGRRFVAQGVAVATLSLLFVGAAASEVADGGVHCRIEAWPNWTPACRMLAERAVAISEARPDAQHPPMRGPDASDAAKMAQAAVTGPASSCATPSPPAAETRHSRRRKTGSSRR